MRDRLHGAKTNDESLDAAPVALPVGRTTLTQRHVARPSEPQRQLDSSILGAAWALRPVQLARDPHNELTDEQLETMRESAYLTVGPKGHGE